MSESIKFIFSTITFLLAINHVRCKNVYITSVDNPVSGKLSNRWVVNTTSNSSHHGTSWNYRNDRYHVCYSPDILQTGQYPLPIGVNSVYADVTFMLLLCTSTIDCTNFLRIGAYVSDNKSQFTASNRAFKKLPSSKPTQDISTFTETYEVANIKGKKFIQYLFHSNYVCGVLSKFKVYYYKCQAGSIGMKYVKFEDTFAPRRNGNDTKQLFGKCIDNSIASNRKTPYTECTWDGKVGPVKGFCECKAGYTNTSTMCKLCGLGEFKVSVGNRPCKRCGKNSYSNANRTLCVCKNGFLRSTRMENVNEAPCNEPNDFAIKKVVAGIDKIYLEWSKPPSSIGMYIVKCLNCPKFYMFNIETRKNNILIRGVGSHAQYKVQIEFVSNTFMKPSVIEVLVNTSKGAPGAVESVEHKINVDGSVSYTWSPPFARGGDNLEYIISQDGKQWITCHPTFTVVANNQKIQRFSNLSITARVLVNGYFVQGPTFKHDRVIDIQDDTNSVIYSTVV